MSETDMTADNNSITDDLLDELDKLETSTNTMESEVERVTENQETLAKTDSPNAIEAATISLESAKTAQQAAEQCQSATETAVQLSQEQKRQAMELADSNVAWRQSVRNVNKELESNKSATTIVLVIAIVVSVLSTSIMGFLFYSVQKKNESLKGEVTDIISTQTELLNKKMTLKTDQMASLVESIVASNQHRATKMQEAPAPVTPKPQATPQPVPKALPEAQAPAAPATTVTAEMDAELKKQIAHLSQIQQQQMSKLDDMIAELTKQQKTEDKKLSKATDTTAIKTAPIEVTSMGLTESQVKKLNAILWRVSNLGKQMKSVKASLAQLKKSPTAKKATAKDKTAAQENLSSIQSSLKSLSEQLQEVKTQQNDLKIQLEAIKESNKKTEVPAGSYEFKAR
ncbi:hypothetical protein [Hydrogenovibrio kuenenii]|uniref:hypothetical protein n=1 Tax=Hydrogenovibrio kuenenii TaxID=63658 RepID=UPI0004645E43|nr:hypothetical protein [Hydrogenovibrio kuenenii]